MEILPAIIAKSKTEFEQKLKFIKPYTTMVQLDVMDGKFVPNISLSNPKIITGVIKRCDSFNKLFFELHLMVENPDKIINKWLKLPKIKRIVFHWEAIIGENEEKRIKALIKKIKDHKIQAGIAINPKTQIEVLKPFIQDVDYVLFLTVNPGFSGQEFQESVLYKIKNFQKIFKNAKIKIAADGGINDKTAKLLKKVGVDILSSQSYIFNSKNPKEAIKKLKN